MIPIDHSVLGKTRAEEHDADVWGKFFIPPYFNLLNLKQATKSTYLVGRRGCGKTMLLKYLDYHSLFSRNRDTIPESETDHVGIYWRIDTHFCNSMRSRGIAEEDWVIIFENYFALIVASEICSSLRHIANSSFGGFNETDLNSIFLDSMPDFGADFPQNIQHLEKYLSSRRRVFSAWISNIDTLIKPFMPAGRSFLDALISDIRKFPKLANVSFYIYVDEIESLVPYQRRVMNTFLKHSQKPLIVSVTSKVLSDENRTVGPESINATHDYTLRSIDDLLDSQEQKCFFAEVFLANLDLASHLKNSERLKLLTNENRISERQDQTYKDRILQEIRVKFPGLDKKEQARQAISEPRIQNILKDKIGKALSNFGQHSELDKFMEYVNYPEALIIAPALLSRRNASVKNILDELHLYSQDEKSSSFTSKQWIHNNLVGALLELYRPYKQSCPLYSGFDTFFTMSNENLRHFLILCYKTLEIAELSDSDISIFGIATQARAAFDAAEELIVEIKTFGEFGERLRLFTLRLGGIFRALQTNPAMSEPEQNQFTINSGNRNLSDDELKFLSEAQKYAILIERLETKTKSTIGNDIVDFQLNPIYAPYFQISYRRKRKIEISVEEFGALSLGTESEYRRLSAEICKTDNIKKSDGSNKNGQLDLLK